MLLVLILIPLIGIFILSAIISYDNTPGNVKILKPTTLVITILDLIVSLMIFILYDDSINQFQFVQEEYEVNYFNFYLGIDGLSIYFVQLTTIIMPHSINIQLKIYKTRHRYFFNNNITIRNITTVSIFSSRYFIVLYIFRKYFSTFIYINWIIWV